MVTQLYKHIKNFFRLLQSRIKKKNFHYFSNEILACIQSSSFLKVVCEQNANMTFLSIVLKFLHIDSRDKLIDKHDTECPNLTHSSPIASMIFSSLFFCKKRLSRLNTRCFNYLFHGFIASCCADRGLNKV